MNLTIISFAIAIVGIVLQVADAFPEHRETRKVIVLLSLGVFVGVGVSALTGAEYRITGDVNRRYALLFGLAGMAGIFSIAAIVVQDSERRETATWFAFGAATIFIMTGVGFGMADSQSSTARVYSTDEVLVLANSAVEHGQIGVAIERLEELKGRVDTTSAKEAIGKRIARLKAAQFGENPPPRD